MFKQISVILIILLLLVSVGSAFAAEAEEAGGSEISVAGPGIILMIGGLAALLAVGAAYGRSKETPSDSAASNTE